MKKLSFTYCLLIALNSNAQNVGIGNADPAEKLDVTGNINVTGTIKANGKDGAPNQLLMKNSLGILEWGDMGEYKNFLTYFSSSTFTVPVGVTKIMVELWAGGGGGNFYCGGGGGGYVKAVIGVKPGNICTIQIGTGGSAANSANAGDGSETNVSVGSTSYSASGGGGAKYLGSSYSSPGLGGAAASSVTAKSYVFVTGDIGGIHTKRYEQAGTNLFYDTTDGGNGGGTYQYPNAGGNAGHNITNLSTSATFLTQAGGADGHLPGGGGASGLVSLGASASAGNGAKGLAIVYY